MTLRRAQTPLGRLHLLDASARSLLAEWYITSVEELLGNVYSSPERIADRLHLDQRQLELLRTEAEEAIDPSVRRALADQAGQEYPVGGLGYASRLAKRSAS